MRLGVVGAALPCLFLDLSHLGYALAGGGLAMGLARAAFSAGVGLWAPPAIGDREGPMAGMPLFAHVGREKLTPPTLSAPFKLIKFCSLKNSKKPGFC